MKNDIQYLTEVRKLQQVAGLITEDDDLDLDLTDVPEFDSRPDIVDVRELVQMINRARKEGKKIAVDGEKVVQWVPFIGRLRTATEFYSVDDVADKEVVLTFDGVPVRLPAAGNVDLHPGNMGDEMSAPY